LIDIRKVFEHKNMAHVHMVHMVVGHWWLKFPF